MRRCRTARCPPETAILTVVHVCAFAVVFAVPGVPLAILLARGRSRSWSSLVVQGIVLGLAATLAVGVSVAHSVGLGRASVGLPMVVMAVVGWGAVIAATDRHRGLPSLRITGPGVAMAGVLVVGLALRLRPVYFLSQTADFGEYVNRGNVVADGGQFTQWFLQLFSITLAISKLVVGEAATVSIVPFLGMLTIAGLVTIAYELGFSPLVRTALATVLALHVLPVWFSLLPSSEALYAALLVGLLLFLLLAIEREHHGEAAVAGGIVGLQMVTRGNALLLLPVLGLGVAAAAVLVPRRVVRRLLTFLGVGVVVSYVGFAYNVRFSHPYFVEYNLRRYLPGGVVDWLDVAALRPALVGLLVVVVVTTVGLLAIDLLNRLAGPPRDGRAVRALRVGLLPAVLVGAVVAVAVLGPRATTESLAGYGVAFGAVALIGVVLALRSITHGSATTPALVAPIVLVAAAFAVLFAYRIPEMRESFTYLYWDRYLYSEVFPLVAVLSLWGLAWIEEHGRRSYEEARPGVARAAVVCVAVVLSLGAVVELGASTALLRQDRYFAGYYEHLTALDELTSGEGDSDGKAVLLFVGMQGELPDGWIHANTHRVFALPLIESFGRHVLNGRQPAAAADRPVDLAVVAELLDGAGVERALAVEVVRPGEAERGVLGSLADDAARSGVAVGRRIGVVPVELPVLADHPRADRSWQRLRVDLVVTEVRRVEQPAEAAA